MSLPAQLWDSVLFFTAYSTSTELRALFADTHDIACVLVCLVCVMADVRRWLGDGVYLAAQLFAADNVARWLPPVDESEVGLWLGSLACRGL